MNNNRVWIIGSLLLSVVILVGGWFIGVAPMLAIAAKAHSDRATVEQQNVQNEQTLADLQARYVELPAISAEFAAIRRSVPEGPEMANFLQTITSAQNASGSFVTDVSVADPVPYAPVVPEPIEAPVSEEGAVATAEGNGEVDAAAADPAAAAPVVPVLSTSSIPNADSVTALNFTLIPVTVTADGTFDQVVAFTGQLQGSERLFLVTGVNISTDESTGVVTGVVTGYIYVFGDPSGVVPDAAAGEGAG
ncbi:hypothetical protein [Marisediminicola antarctica]|uniref:Pilus assembly protein PilO n=1 Tax=Marisediminicola antarctica TaxID=674079 RepID=A0A7L5AI06_9MICO|nr:hypothetical protein [Marisediminicola antarctica]QHO69024.1 hypothetical protein BHD05_04570 [Marisediminicola antarctica]